MIKNYADREQRYNFVHDKDTVSRIIINGILNVLEDDTFTRNPRRLQNMHDKLICNLDPEKLLNRLCGR